MKIVLTEDQKDFLNMGSRIITPEFKYSYIPYWFREDKEGNFEMFILDKLPEDLVEKIKEDRNK